MTQQRHIEAAEKIVEDLIVNGGFVLQRYKSAKIIALAIAEAENRAAWDGWNSSRSFQQSKLLAQMGKIEEYMESKYGPREVK